MILSELSRQPFELRKKFWLEKLQLPIQWKDLPEEAMQDPLQFLKPQGFDGLLLDLEFSEILLPASPRIAAEIMEAGFADSLIREEAKVWLRCFLREALRLLILKKAPRLDTHATCYVTGSDMRTRLCAVVAVQMGYQKLIFVASDVEQAEMTAAKLKKLFFGLDITILGENELTLQPNNGSLLMNTLSVETGGVVLEDLAYLNFLKKDGLVVDIPLSFKTSPLLDEAAHIGVQYFSGIEIWGYRDYLFLQSLLKNKFSFSSDEYLSQWSSFLASENQT